MIEWNVGQTLDALDAPIVAEYNRLLAQAEEGFSQLQARADAGELPALSLPYEMLDLDNIQQSAKRLRHHSEGLVVCGTGGSSLGGQTVCALGDGSFPVEFIDNAAPVTLTRLLARDDLDRLSWLFVSKSGGTVETVSQAAAILPVLKKRLGDKLPKQAMAITMPGARPLRELAEQYALPILDHDPHVGGRYSVLSLVGLLPACAAGVNIKQLRAGAGLALDSCQDNITASFAAQGAALSVATMQAYPMQICMPYSDRLRHFAAWYQQLWAESIGKDGKGSTPIRAIGSVDQHSQLQLWLDGPADKLFTLLTLDHRDTGPRMAADLPESIAHLRGQPVGNVMHALQHGTVETLRAHNRPLRHIAIKRLSEQTLGELLMMFMLETMLAASMMGVDAFDQPAVEHGKQIARHYLMERGKA